MWQVSIDPMEREPVKVMVMLCSPLSNAILSSENNPMLFQQHANFYPINSINASIFTVINLIILPRDKT